MDFNDTATQDTWRNEVRTFLKNERPKAMPEDASPQEAMRAGGS